MYAGKIPFPNLDGSFTQIDNKEFDLTLKFLETIVPSKKNPKRVRHILIGSDGTKFSMMPQEFEQLLAVMPNFKTGGTFIRANWEFTKRGDAFGVKLGEKMLEQLASPIIRVPPTTPHDNPMHVNNAGAVTQTPPAPEPAPVAKQRKTLFALCLDSSGSMGSIPRTATVAAVNGVLQSIRDGAKQNNQIAEIMLMKFGVGHSGIETTFGLTPIEQVRDMDVASYQPSGGTPLFECIGRAMNEMKARPEFQDPDVSFFIHAITDGDENASRHPYTPEQVNQMIAEMQATDRWTFAVQVPTRSVTSFIQRYAVPAGNVQGWVQTAKGVDQASQSTGSAMRSYMSARSVGVRSVKNVYTTDLSAVKLEDLRSKLIDVSSAVKFLKVEKEASIKEFAEEKTKVPYVTGSVYYCLTKKEDVQPYKFPEFLIRVKNTKTVYGGPEACKLVGIDPTNTSTISVIPGNHSNYDIYAPSTSVNRKLVRGTDTIYLPRAVPLKETWDSAAAKAIADAKKAAAGQTPSP